MTRVALRGLLGRKLRSALTATAIVLGVAMIAGTYVLTDTINGSFSTLYQDIYKGTDAFIQAKSAIKTSNTNGVVPPSFPESVLTKVRAVKDVKVAIGGVSSYPVSVVGTNGKIIVNGGAPNLGFSIDTTPQFSSLSLVSGSWPRPDELVIDVSTAKKSGYKVGDMVPIIANGPEHKMRLSGIVKFGTSNGILGATLAGFELRTAQELFGKVGQFDSIQVAAKPGVTPEKLVADLKQALPNMVIRTGQAQVQKDTSDTSAQISIFRDFLLAFAGIALFVGIFVIVNSLSITIAQRTREFATLRTLGASRAQVLLSILTESAIVGAIASVVGLFLGFGLARFLLWFFRRLGLELPPNAMVIQTRTVVVALVVGMVVTLFASLRPALRATRVPPIAAVREGATLPPSRFHRFRVIGSTALVVLGFLSLLYGLFAHGLTTKQILLSIGVGAVLIFIGTSLVSSRFVKPLATIVSPLGKWAVMLLSVLVWPFSVALWAFRHVALGNGTEFPGVLPDRTMTKLALENAIRGKQRTASTAAALMIGLALVTLVAVFAASLTSSFKGAVNSIFTGDYAITAENNFQPIPIAASQAAAKAPGVEAIANVRAGSARVFDKTVFVTAVDPGAAKVMRLNWKDGSNATLARLGVNGAVVDDGFAKTHHLRAGSPVAIVTPTGQQLTFLVKGIFKPPTGGSPFGAVTFSAAVFDQAFQNPQNLYTLVKMRGGETPANTKALDRALASFPNAKSQTRQQFIDNQIAPLNRALAVLYVLLAFSVLISFFGIVNTLVLTVFERTRELGMLRAIGTTQRQAKRMIRHESVITALIGAALGIALGLIFGGLLVDRIQYVQFSLPGTQLIVFAFAAVIVGIVAAIFPARRAARLNILEALQYE
jgi:putative ABC transport system permease protein